MAYHGGRGHSHSHGHGHSHGGQRGDETSGNYGWGMNMNMRGEFQTQTQSQKKKQRMNQTVKMELFLEQILKPSLNTISKFVEKMGNEATTPRELRAYNSMLNGQLTLNFGNGLDSENFDFNDSKDKEILIVAKTRVEKFKNAMISSPKNGKRLNSKQMEILNNYCNYIMNGLMGVNDLPFLPVIDKSEDWNEQNVGNMMSHVLVGNHKTNDFMTETEQNLDEISRKQRQEILESQNAFQENGNDYSFNMESMTLGMSENDKRNRIIDYNKKPKMPSLNQRRRQNENEKIRHNCDDVFDADGDLNLS